MIRLNNQVHAKVNCGLEGLSRIVGLLKRKRFKVTSVHMEQIENSDFAHLKISIEDSLDMGINQAISQLEKLVDVYEIKKVEAFN